MREVSKQEAKAEEGQPVRRSGRTKAERVIAPNRSELIHTDDAVDRRQQPMAMRVNEPEPRLLTVFTGRCGPFPVSSGRITRQQAPALASGRVLQSKPRIAGLNETDHTHGRPLVDPHYTA